MTRRTASFKRQYDSETASEFKVKPLSNKNRSAKTENESTGGNAAMRPKRVCFRCRQAGHRVSECPQIDPSGAKKEKNLCYACGSIEHRLNQCPKKKSTRLYQIIALRFDGRSFVFISRRLKKRESCIGICRLFYLQQKRSFGVFMPAEHKRALSRWRLLPFLRFYATSSQALSTCGTRLVYFHKMCIVYLIKVKIYVRYRINLCNDEYSKMVFRRRRNHRVGNNEFGTFSRCR
jgi:hypothetical protein